MGSGRSEVKFTNSTGAKIFVAYMRRDFGCGDCPSCCWDVLGWINLDPGETETRSNPTTNKWFYYYAEDANGRVWSGPFPAEVKQTQFEKCKCIGVIVQNGDATNPYHTVGFRELDVEQFTGVNFT
jgi:uncharacterized membrane protein